MGDDMHAALLVPAVKICPIVGVELALIDVRPCDEMAAVVGGQIDAIRLVVAGDDDATDVWDRVFLPVLFIDPQDVGRCRR